MLSLRKGAIWPAAEQTRQRDREARFAAEQQRRAEPRAQVEGEMRRAKRLEEDATAWRRAEAIRAYAAARHAAVTGGEGEGDLAAWLAWAHEQADRIDPMRPNPPSILDTPESDLQPLSLWSFPND